jgi:hypothetical protein
MKYYCKSDNVTEVFAGAELAKYAKAISGMPLIKTQNLKETQFLLGCFSELGEYIGNELKDDYWEDSILLKSINGQLIISGSNPRSVLFAVYDYLERLGCRWLEPGPDGDLLPRNMDLKIQGFDVLEKADYQYRGLSAFPRDVEFAKMLIDWMPKKKYNLYFLEGYPEERPGDMWSIVNGEHPLQHTELILALKEKTWKERLKIINAQNSVVEEARKRGFLIERYGHGWNYGIQEHYASIKKISIEQAYKEIRAKGQVEKHADTGGIWFQICMSKPGIRDLYIEHITDYLNKHKDEIDIAAIWLGDGYDNSCQCRTCIQKPFSDWYLEILSEVARQMKNSAPNLKLEGLIYLETLEPPSKRFFDGLDNVVFNFAPWGRCYMHPLNSSICHYPDWKPDYRNNKSHDSKRFFHPLNADYYEAYSGWRKKISNPCYLFDYYSLFPGPDRGFLGYNAKNIARDIKDCKKLEFEGCVSCQNATPDFPVNLITETVGQILWDRSKNPDLIRKELIDGLFGDLSAVVVKHFNKMYEILTKVDTHKNLFFTEDLAVIQKIVKGLEKRQKDFEKEFQIGSLSQPVKKRVLQLKFTLLIVYLQFREALARRNLYKDETIGLFKDFIKFIEGNRENIAFRNIDGEIKRIESILSSL